MWRTDERVVLDRPGSVADGGDLGGDLDHGVAEAVELAQRFRFGRFDHQGPGDRERHRGGVEAVVDQPLGDVLGGDADRLLDRPDVHDALVRHQPTRSGVEDRVVLGQPSGHVVGAEDRAVGGGAQAIGAHHGDVHPRDRQDAGRSVRCGGDGTHRLGRVPRSGCSG